MDMAQPREQKWDDYDSDDDAYDDGFDGAYADDYSPAAAKGGGGKGNGGKCTATATTTVHHAASSRSSRPAPPSSTLAPAHAVLRRLQSLPMELQKRCEVGYEDRFAGTLFTTVPHFASAADGAAQGGSMPVGKGRGLAIPLHRVTVFRVRGSVVWDRATRHDELSSSSGGGFDLLASGPMPDSAFAAELEQRLANLTAGLASCQIRPVAAAAPQAGGGACTGSSSSSSLVLDAWCELGTGGTVAAATLADAFDMATVGRDDGDFDRYLGFVDKAVSAGIRFGALFAPTDSAMGDNTRDTAGASLRLCVDAAAQDAANPTVVSLQLAQASVIALCELQRVLELALSAAISPVAALRARHSTLRVRVATEAVAKELVAAGGDGTVTINGFRLMAPARLVPGGADAAAPTLSDVHLRGGHPHVHLVAAFAMDGSLRPDVRGQLAAAVREKGPAGGPLPAYVPADALESWLSVHSRWGLPPTVRHTDVSTDDEATTFISQRGGVYTLAADAYGGDTMMGRWLAAIEHSPKTPFFVEEVRPADRFRFYLDVDLPLSSQPPTLATAAAAAAAAPQGEHDADERAFTSRLLYAVWQFCCSGAGAGSATTTLTPELYSTAAEPTTEDIHHCREIVAFRCFGAYDDASPARLPIASKLGLRLYFPGSVTDAVRYPGQVARLAEMLDAADTSESPLIPAALKARVVRREAGRSSFWHEALDADHAEWDRGRLIGTTKRRRVQHFDRRYTPLATVQGAAGSAATGAEVSSLPSAFSAELLRKTLLRA